MNMRNERRYERVAERRLENARVPTESSPFDSGNLRREFCSKLQSCRTTQCDIEFYCSIKSPLILLLKRSKETSEKIDFVAFE